MTNKITLISKQTLIVNGWRVCIRIGRGVVVVVVKIREEWKLVVVVPSMRTGDGRFCGFSTSGTIRGTSGITGTGIFCDGPVIEPKFLAHIV